MKRLAPVVFLVGCGTLNPMRLVRPNTTIPEQSSGEDILYWMAALIAIPMAVDIIIQRRISKLSVALFSMMAGMVYLAASVNLIKEHSGWFFGGTAVVALTIVLLRYLGIKWKRQVVGVINGLSIKVPDTPGGSAKEASPPTEG